MGAIADIISMVKDLKDFSTNRPNNNNFQVKYTRNSISRGSANGIMQFPVLTSNALSFDDLTMVNKALEREYATFIRVMVSMDDVIDLSKGETKASKIKSLHQNMGSNGQGKVGMRNGSFFAESKDLRFTNIYETFEQKNIELLQCYKEDLNMTVLNDMTIKGNDNYYNLSEAKRGRGTRHNFENANRRIGSKKDRISKLNQDLKNIEYNVNSKTAGAKIRTAKANADRAELDRDFAKDTYGERIRTTKANADRAELDRDFAKDTYNDRLLKTRMDAKSAAMSAVRGKIGIVRDVTGVANDVAGLAQKGVSIYNSIQQEKRSKEKHGWDRDRHEWDTYDRNMQSMNRGVATNRLLDTDVKKANELVPTLLDISLYYSNGQGPMQETNVVVGVKTVAHLVNTDEMTNAVATAVKEKRSFFRFIQWTTGEISTFKDYLLCVDRLKGEASSRTNSSTWWRRLRNRASIDKMYRMSSKDVMPNATIVLTMDEVEYIKNNYNIDLMRNKQALNALFKTFFLLGFVIVDPMSEVAYFMFDGRDDFEVQSYRALQRESTSGSDIKSIINLIDKTR